MTMLVRGAALQAQLLVETGSGTGGEDEHVQKAFERGNEPLGIKATAHMIECHSPMRLGMGRSRETPGG